MNLVEEVQQLGMKNPKKIAIHYNGQDTTYGEFEVLVGKLAYSLKKSGIQKGDHVAFLLGNSPHFLISLYACMRIGATAIPVNPIYTIDEIKYIFDNGDVKTVIALDSLLPKLQEGRNAFPQVGTYIICETNSEFNQHLYVFSEDKRINTLRFNELITTAEKTLNTIEVNEEDTAIILYTSGTTGYPKGAQLTHQNLYANARDVAHFMEFTEEDRVIATLPLFHVFALTVVANAPLLKGATILIAPKFSPKEIFDLARDLRATVFAGVPTMFNFLYQHEEGKEEDFSSLRLAISGGAPLPAQVLHNFEGKFKVRISEGYGLSEASPVTCFNPLNRERKVGSIGTSITNVENKVVDEDGNELPVGEVGELIVSGPNVMSGYYKMPEETKKTIKNGWLYTGDLARKDEEGYFYIVDRKKDMINVGGFKVYPREVEEVLYQHSNVTEAAVIGLPDPDFGEAVHAYIVMKDDGITADEIKQFCSHHLAKYKIPKAVHMVNELPKNSTGKILRRALKTANGSN